MAIKYDIEIDAGRNFYLGLVWYDEFNKPRILENYHAVAEVRDSKSNALIARASTREGTIVIKYTPPPEDSPSISGSLSVSPSGSELSGSESSGSFVVEEEAFGELLIFDSEDIPDNGLIELVFTGFQTQNKLSNKAEWELVLFKYNESDRLSEPYSLIRGKAILRKPTTDLSEFIINASPPDLV